MNPDKKYILLSFDVEEFDMPLEYGQEIPLAEQMDVGFRGLEALTQVLSNYQIQSTFFTTANFAREYPTEIKNLGIRNEIASHTYYHSTFQPVDLLASRIALEEITDKPIRGLRMPRMRSVSMSDVKEAGYLYDSSVNPIWLPGRYNNLRLPRTIYNDEGMIRLPASVSPHLRVPLFWLSLKNLPYSMYLHFAKRALAKDGYICLYFHPWEFINLDKYKIPGYTKKLAGQQFQELLSKLIQDLQKEAEFVTVSDYLGVKQLL
jgi:peptidoglycan/xylan/chitin deacetylase (PgdA/CDA1 family)